MKTAATLILTTALFTSASVLASDQDRIDAFLEVASEVTDFIQATNPTVEACQKALDQAGAEGMSWDACQSVRRLQPDVTAALKRFKRALDTIELMGLSADPQVDAAAVAATRIVRENRIRVSTLAGTMSALADEAHTNR